MQYLIINCKYMDYSRYRQVKEVKTIQLQKKSRAIALPVLFIAVVTFE